MLDNIFADTDISVTNWPANISTGLLAWNSAQMLAGPVVDTCWIEIFGVDG